MPIDDDVTMPKTVGMAPDRVQLPAMPVPPQHPPMDKDGMLLRIPDRGSFEVSLETVVKQLDRDFTLEAWLWFEHDGDQMILSAGDGLRLRLDHCILYGEVGSERLTGMKMTLREWYHVAVVVQKDEARLYINGAFQDREFVGQAWARPTGTLVLGYHPDSTRSFRGEADNLRMVRSALYQQPQFSPTNHLVPVDDTLFGFSFDSEAPGGVIHSVAGPTLSGKLVGPAGLTGGHI